MQRSKLIAVLFYLGAVVIGAAVGIGADRMLVRDWMDRRAQDPGKARQTFAQRLNLTPAQQAAADSIFGAARKADSVLREPIRLKADSVFKSARDELRLRLTAEQQKTYQAYEDMRRRPRPSDARR